AAPGGPVTPVPPASGGARGTKRTAPAHRPSPATPGPVSANASRAPMAPTIQHRSSARPADEELFRQAIARYDAGDNSGALRLFRAAALRDASDPVTHTWI